MGKPRLNLYPASISPQTADTATTGSQRRERELDRIAGAAAAKTMSVPLGVMVPLLMRAAENNHTWLEDFANDVVQIDADLHEILMAFGDMPDRRAA